MGNGFHVFPSSLSYVSTTLCPYPPPFPNTDPLQQEGYWEELFMKGSAAAANVGTAPEGSAAPAAAAAEMGAVGVEVISFDLDDTLWCGKTVIANANKYVRACMRCGRPRVDRCAIVLY